MMVGGALMIASFLVALVGAAVSTVTVEASPRKPRKKPITPAAALGFNITALVLILTGVAGAIVGAVLVSIEVLS